VPTQLQLEGPDLESLLVRVKSELGPGARIVRAEKVRSGGIAGFFATQRFEVTVELGHLAAAAPASVPTPKPTPAAPVSLLDLADQVSDSEHSSGLSLRRSATAPAAAQPAGAAPQPAPAPAPQVETQVETPSEEPARNSSFAAVLASIGATTGTGPTMIPRLPAPEPTPEPATAPVAADLPDEAVDPDRVPASDPLPDELVALERSSTQVSTEGSTFAAFLADLDAATGGPATPAAPPAAAPTAPPVPSLAEPAPAAPGVVDIPTARGAQAPAVVAPSALPVHNPFGRAPGHPTVSGQLARLGLPEHLQPATADAAVYPALLESLRCLPEAPEPANQAGAVLAVVGPLAQSLQTARALARELNLPVASAVVAATTHRALTDLPERQVLRDADQAETRRATWRRRRNLTIVAVDAPMTAAGALQARVYLQALEPTTTWGAVEATRKPYDVAGFARAVGGFQALALSAVDDTSDPAAVLELGIPVARLDDKPATPSAWAALLAGRVAA
jgi:hypothetical protein